MQEYGPLNINYPSHMKSLARVILSVAVEVTDDLAGHEHTREN